MAATVANAASIPIDVLGEIFVLCAQDEQATRIELAQRCESPSSRQSILRTGLVVGQVCRLWRIAALSTPSMWRFVHVDLKKLSRTFRSSNQYQRPAAAIFGLSMSGSGYGCADFTWECLSIRRSGSCPLQLSFSNLGSNESLRIVRSFLTGGINYNLSQSIERLEIGLTGASFLPLLSVLLDSDVDDVITDLKSLSVYHTGYFTVHEAIPEDVILKLQYLTNLRDLSFGRIQWQPYPSGINLDKITTLSLDLGHKHEALLMRTLTSFPNLIELILQCTDNIKLTDIDVWAAIPTVTLESLQHISFDPRICHYTLHKLYAPNLNKVTARQFTRLSPRFLARLAQSPHTAPSSPTSQLQSHPRLLSPSPDLLTPSRPSCPTKLTTLRLEQFLPHEDLDQVSPVSPSSPTRRSSQDSWSYKSLEDLKMKWTSHFTPGVQGFVECLRNHPEIVNLELVNCSLTDEYLSCLVGNCEPPLALVPHLSSLKLINCPYVSRPLLDRIASHRRSFLSLSNNAREFQIESIY